MENKSYYGKIILFGEYSMIFGSDALLIPYYAATAKWNSILNKPSERSLSSNKELVKLFNFLSKNDKFNILDLKRFKMELNAGLFFDSDIPCSYGVGSSGALIAAVYERFHLIEITAPFKLKQFLAEMENCYHNSSSGIDPLQCYYGQPFVLTKGENFKLLNHDFIPENIHIFLIDTKINSETKPLVAYFKEQRKNKDYLNRFNKKYVPLVSACISALIEKDEEKFFNNLDRLSKMQTDLLRPMIPDKMLTYFNANVADNHFQVKICGSGGGGYLLGFSDNAEETEKYWNKTDYQITWIR